MADRREGYLPPRIQSGHRPGKVFAPARNRDEVPQHQRQDGETDRPQVAAAPFRRNSWVLFLQRKHDMQDDVRRKVSHHR